MRRWLAVGAAVLLAVLFFAVDTAPLSDESPRGTDHPLAPRAGARPSLTTRESPVLPSPGETLRVLEVIDGDTILLTDGRRIRYIGIDTPELSDPRLGVAAIAAREANARLVSERDLRIETDVQLLDRYGRTLAYVWAGETFVNAELLREGVARLLTIPPNIRYIAELSRAAAAGAERRQEFWTPQEEVAGVSTAIGSACPADTPVKGNITREGEKIYHTPSGAFYDRTRPEECFATAAEAERAGYRASRR